MCTICKFSLCGECYQPTLLMKQKIHHQKKLQKISNRIRNTAAHNPNINTNTTANNISVNHRQRPRIKNRSSSNNNDNKPPHKKTQSNSLLHNSRTSSHQSGSHQSGRSHSQIRSNNVHVQSLVQIQKQRNNSSSDSSTHNNNAPAVIVNRALMQSITYSNFNEFSNENNNNTNFDAVNLEDLSSILQDLQNQNNLNISVGGGSGNNTFIQQSPNTDENILLGLIFIFVHFCSFLDILKNTF